MSQIQVDPAIMNNVYREKLAAANDEIILLTAACTQLQTKVEELEQSVATQQSELDFLSAPKTEELPSGE